jgi:dipeptidyl aminopeptidase/acylaminoacyl peptidase
MLTLRVARLLCFAGPFFAVSPGLLGCDQGSQHGSQSTGPTPPTESLEPASAEPAPLATAHPDPTLIPRRVILGADYVRVRISPDGKTLGWLAPVNGVRNVWVAPVDDLSSAHPVTHEAIRSIRLWDFSPTSTQLHYTQDKNGDENTHVYFVDLATEETRDLTPGDGVRSTFEAASAKDPRHVVIGQNARDPRVVDLYRVDVTTGESTLLAQNEGDYSSWTIDGRLRVTGAHRANPDGSVDMLTFDEKLGTRTLLHVPFEDNGTLELLGQDASKGAQTLKDSRGRNTSVLTVYNAKTGTSQILAEDPHADVGYVPSHPRPQAASFTYERTRWQVVDPAVQADFDYLGNFADGDLAIDTRSSDDKRWVVSYRTSSHPRVYYLYDRSPTPGAAGHATMLFPQSKELAGLVLPETHPVILRSRDGLDLVSYLTVPLSADPTGSGKPSHPLPMVLWVHGGPQDRDGFGFDENAQWAANRGYVVLRVNFRGSTGFGKAFLNAGNGEYGAKMQNDLLDAVAWAVSQGIADPTKIAIMGPSYGGYATLVGLTSTPKTFACGVDVYGMPDLLARLQTMPYSLPSGAWEVPRVGDPTTAAGRALLLEQSPLTHVAVLAKPLLIFQGANDPRVLKSESDRFVDAAKPLGLPVTYAVYPDEGHGFSRPANVFTFFAVTELFLAQCLGGSYEPMSDDSAGSSLTVPWGADYVHGLE